MNSAEHPPSPEEHPPAAASRERDSLIALLGELATSCGVEFDARLARTATRRATEAHPEDERGLERLARAARELGIRVEIVSWPARRAIRSVGRNAALVTYAPRDPEGERWIKLERPGLFAARGQRLHEEVSRRYTARQLEHRLGAPRRGAPLPFAIAVPAKPVQLMHTDDEPGGHGPGHAPLPPARRYLRLLWSEYPDIKMVVIFAIAGAALTLAVPIAVDAFITNVMFGTIVQPLVVLTTALLGCLVMLGILQGFQVYVVEVIQRRIFVRVAADFAWRLPRVRREALDDRHGPELVNRFLETVIVQKKTASILMYAVNTILSTLVGMTVLSFFHPALFTFVLLLLAALAIIVFAMGRRAIRTATLESHAKYEVVDWLQELVRHDTAFATRGGADLALRRLDEHCRTYLTNRGRHFRILFRQITGGLILQALAATAVLGIGGWLVINQQLTPGQLVASELIVSAIVANIAKIGQILEGWYDVCASADKLGHVIDLPLEREGGESLLDDPNHAEISLRGVSYGYPGHPNVIRALDLEVRAGEHVAVVGRLGSGVSTLFDLLYGLREPREGSIAIGGMDVRDLSLASLRARVALVRGPEIVDGTVLENVRLANPDLELWEVRNALELVGMWEHVLALPHGLNTHLRSGGPTLSFGQANRITLARAIANRPRILLIDNALDLLNPQSRTRIARALLAPENPWTVMLSSQHEELDALCERRVTLVRDDVSPAVTSGGGEAEGHA